MKVKSNISILFIFYLILQSELVFSVTHFGSHNDLLKPKELVINNSDSVIFNLNNATLTASYIDIPVFVKSDDVVFAIDFAFHFNLSKLTYSSSISTLIDPTVSFSAYFNPSDLFLRYTGYTLQSYPNNGLVCLTKIRFLLSAPCNSITAADFSNGSAQLNGSTCAFRFVNLDYSQYLPTADFGFSNPCLGSLMFFSDSSSVGKGAITQWNWNFGNGSISTLQNDIKTFTLTGVNSTTLQVVASSGCTNSVAKGFTVSDNPVANFTYTLDCLKDSVFFTNTSVFPGGTINSSTWYFGDNSALSYITNPSHKYVTSGNFKIKLTVTANTGCSSVISQDFQIRPTDFTKDGFTDINDYLIFLPLYSTPCDN